MDDRLQIRPSLRLDVGGADDLTPFFGKVDGELSETGRRIDEHGAAQVGEPLLELGIGKAGVDFRIELLDDVNGRVLRRADAPPSGRIVVRHELRYGRNVR